MAPTPRNPASIVCLPGCSVAAWRRESIFIHRCTQMHADKMGDNVPTLAEIRTGGTELICVHLRASADEYACLLLLAVRTQADHITRCSRGSPAASRRQFSAASVKLRSNVPVVSQAMCGVSTVLGRVHSASAGSGGSSTKTSR